MSVVRPLPHRPSLTNLRKQAKSLLAGWRAGDQQALTRVRELHPQGDRLTATGRHSLADAQLVVAREYGFASWARLVHHLRLTPNAQALHIMDQLFQATLGPAGEPGTVGQILDRRVGVVWQAHLDGRSQAVIRAAGLIATGNLLRAAGAVTGIDGPDGGGPSIDDVRGLIAHEHGFADWAAVAAHRDQPVDARFEAAVDAIVSGDPDALHALLDTDPTLARARSPFGHHATLVHYVTANGVESSRQWQSPRNAVQILRILLRHGATPDAVCDAYGGGLTPMCALVSSAHPANAGVQGGLVEELCRGGANPNGLDEDGLPLWTAITYGYPAAVDALARSGARVDNLVFAAAVGDVPRVKTFLQHGGADRPGSAARVGARGPALDPDRLLEYALIYSAGLGRRAVVELLLAQNPDLSVTEPVWRSTEEFIRSRPMTQLEQARLLLESLRRVLADLDAVAVGSLEALDPAALSESMEPDLKANFPGLAAPYAESISFVPDEGSTAPEVSIDYIRNSQRRARVAELLNEIEIEIDS